MSTFDINLEREKITAAAAFITSTLDSYKSQYPSFGSPKVLVVCGSGLSGISNRLSADNPPPLTISYDSIPFFNKSTVEGHQGTLMFGIMNSTPVALMNGRLHTYEGHTPQQVTFPIRILNRVLGGSTVLVATNAAGGLNPVFKPGDLMCVYDHINIPGLGGLHPLKGPNLDEFGPRFLPLSDAYDLELRKLLLRKYEDLGIERPLHEGTYCYVSGPTFETRAESRLLRLVGGDAVGMSTVPEVIAARHCGWRVLALSLITNACVTEPPASFHDANPVAMDEGIASHQEVLENGRKASLDVERLVEAVIGEF